MVLGSERFVCPRTVRVVALVIAVAGLSCWGCGGARVAPLSPAAQEPQEPEDKEQAWNPFVVVEPGGRIFMTYYHGRGASEYRLLFTRSLDGGVTWLPEPVQLDTPIPARSRIGFHQLESNGDDRMSATWSIEGKEEAYWRPKEVRNRQSSDLGATWSGELSRWPFLQQSNYPTPVTGRDGVFYLLWMEGLGSQAVPHFIRTTGAGMAWAPGPLTLPGIDSAESAPSKHRRKDPSIRRMGSWPALAIGPRGTLYSVWQEESAKGTDILFNRSGDGGSTWLESSLRLNTPPPTPTYTSRIPVIAVKEEGHIYVVWEDFRHNTTDLYFNRSLDGGATWLPQDLWVTAVRPQAASASSPILSVDKSGHVYLLWTDIREAPDSLYFNRSLDRGATWHLNPIRLDRHATNEITYAARLANDDAGHVYAAWWEGTQAKGTVRFKRSEDYGATWPEGERILDSGKGKNGPRFPWLSADGEGGVYIVWSSDRTGRYQLYLNRSLDHGKTWLPQDVQITGRPLVKTQGS